MRSRPSHLGNDERQTRLTGEPTGSLSTPKNKQSRPHAVLRLELINTQLAATCRSKKEKRRSILGGTACSSAAPNRIQNHPRQRLQKPLPIIGHRPRQPLELSTAAPPAATAPRRLIPAPTSRQRIEPGQRPPNSRGNSHIHHTMSRHFFRKIRKNPWVHGGPQQRLNPYEPRVYVL